LLNEGRHGDRGGSQIGDKLVGAGKTDLGIVNAKGCHLPQQVDGVGHGDVDIRLLQAIAQAGVEDFDFSGFLQRRRNGGLEREDRAIPGHRSGSWGTHFCAFGTWVTRQLE